MSDDRDKLIRIMNSLEADYRSGKISRPKYEYFYSKYQDKLNSIDAVEATRRIRSMQGKPTTSKKIKRNKRSPSDKRKHEEDLVQKYIINPKKDDAKYNKKKKSSMDGGTFKLLLVLVLVVGFTVGIAYGFFSLEFEEVSDASAVGIVEDSAFPEIEVDLNNTTMLNTTWVNVTTEVTNNTDDANNIETTTDSGDDSTSDTSISTSKKSSSSSKKSTSGGSSGNSGSGRNSGGSSQGGSGTGGGGSTDSGTGGGSGDSGGSEGADSE